ncbi:Leucine-rich repeat-containing protein 56 [Holothuria leucospilota]|uniref:Leucine-rich repeat-containing protein 56 n=1 Tax=Holothuria leucospilota TaxID=206669 RepID=A0A9Q1BDX1_HOLLE|nr:Leucine-rich repeat-containing protein 56 [Holothuria leucospilota]
MTCVEQKIGLKRRSIPPPLVLTNVELTSSMASAGGIHITDFGSADVNPQPVQIEETDTLLEDYLSPTKLKSLAGVEDLEEVTFLELNVDSCETSLGNFGTMLPNLKQLKLNNSVIATVRDLGTCLENLRVLWMARCYLCDLDGISSMSSLQELYLAYNNISDVSPCSMLENLCLLDIEGNNIDDMAQVDFLRLCGKLNILTLEGNPVCLAPKPDYNKEVEGEFDYRKAVSKAIPQLTMLDDEPISSLPSSLGSTAMNLSTDWLLVNDAIKEAVASSSDVSDAAGRPTSARPSSASRRRPGSSKGGRPGSSAGNRPGTARRPGTAGGRGSAGTAEDDEEEDDTSALTHGSVICGNPVRALRARRQKHRFQAPVQEAPSIFAAMRFIPEHSYIEEEEDDGRSKEDIFKELRKWKEEHEKKVAVRRKESEPQILKITHEDEDSSGDESLESNNNHNNYHQTYFSQRSNSGEDEDTGIEMTPPSTGSSDHRGRSSPENGDRIPTPPKPPKGKQPLRPKTAGDFRSRRFRRSSSEEAVLSQSLGQVEISQSREISLEDSGHMSPSMLQSSFPSPPPLPTIEERPFSGPVQGNRKFKSGNNPVDKEQNVINKHEPVIRTATQTPPNLAQRFSNSMARPSTAKAALQRGVLSKKASYPRT